MFFRKAHFLDRLVGWWRTFPSSGGAGRGFMTREECEADPASALAELQEEQTRIAEELEATFLAYDKKLRIMARRLAGINGEPPGDKELEKLREEQLELWRLVRRAQAAARTTRELKRELKEWQARESGAVSFGHPDHPATRAELVSSELRVRVGAHSVGAHSCAPLHGLRNDGRDDVLLEDAFEAQAGPSWDPGTDEGLLREIRGRQKEMERLLALGGETDEDTAREAALLAEELRELHGHLRLRDRQNGVERERLEI